MTESAISKKIKLIAHKVKSNLFRNNVGKAWIGNGKPLFLKQGQVYVAKEHEIVIPSPRVLHAGLCEGSSDDIGWLEVIITQEMVGNKFAVFLAVESKMPKTGKASEKQVNFINAVNKAGGIGIFSISPEDFVQKIIDYKKQYNIKD